MLTDEQVMEFIEKRQIKKYEHGYRTPEVLNAVLDSLEKKYYIGLMERICRSENNISKFMDLDNGLNRLINIAINNRSTTIYSLIGYVNAYDFEEIENKVINTNDAGYICDFSTLECVANHIEKFEEAIIKTGDARYIYLFATSTEKANIPKLEDGIIKTGNAEYIYQFAKDIKDANIEKLEDGIIKTGNAKSIYNFAKNINGANIEKLEDGIIKTGNAKSIYNFAKNINGANIEKIENALIDINDEEYINLLKNNKKLMYLKQAQILTKRQIDENIIPFAMTILLKNQGKERILDELIENVNDKDNLLKLKVYMIFLSNSDNSLEKAFELDREYTNAVQLTKKKNNEK